VPSPTDHLLATYAAELEERQAFIDGIVKAAAEKGEDLDGDQLELITRARDRMDKVNELMKPLEESARIVDDSRARIEQLAHFMEGRKNGPPTKVEYRSAGQYALDMWRAGLGNAESRERLQVFNRAAAHQTTADNPGLLPEQILGPVVNFIDSSRPLVSTLGPRQLPSGSWSRPRITQHTLVDAQSAEKAELASRKMIIGKVPVTAQTLGGYVNVSRQDIDWTQPAIMDLVINDLAGQYALETEQSAVQAFYTGATAGPTIPATPDGDAVAGALWEAAADVFVATQGQGRLIAVCSPDVLGLVGPLFAPVNPQNAQSTGFNAGSFGTGAVGAISGISIVVTAGFAAAKSLMVLSSAAAEIYEDRVGALQVVEPSVLGVQVAYAGYFAKLIMEATGIQKITVT
jgi:HK97 family phage major capsid protein